MCLVICLKDANAFRTVRSVELQLAVGTLLTIDPAKADKEAAKASKNHRPSFESAFWKGAGKVGSGCRGFLRRRFFEGSSCQIRGIGLYVRVGL